LDDDSLIKRHVNQKPRLAGAGFRAAGQRIGSRSAHATGLGLAYDRRNG
jgi:hypothetical protein